MQQTSNLTLLVQVGDLGPSVIDHLISPVALVDKVRKILVFCHHQGPPILKVEYHCPPKLLARFALSAVVYESISLFCLALFHRSATIAGFYLSPHGLIAYIVAKLTRKKVIVFLIAGRPELYTKGSIQGIDFNTTLLPWHGKIYLNILKHSDAIITTGSLTKDFLIKHGIVDNKIYPIISPVSISKFRIINLPKIYDLVSVGYLYPIKHHEVLLRTLFEVKKRYPNIKACIVGDGPCKQNLIQLASDLELKDNIDFAGYQKDVVYYYNSSKILVHTSETEGFPNVFLEATMCGLPSVVSNCGDIVDIARDSFNSIVVQDFNDYESFANAICNLLGDAELRNKLSRNALTTIESISLRNTTRQWEAILG